MLQKKFRLTKKSDFQKVLKEGKKVSGRCYVLSVLTDPSLEFSKIGVIVSNKISKKATERNRIKRLLREAVRKGFHNIKKKSLLVFIAKGAVLGVSGEEIAKEVKYLLDKGVVVSNP